MAAIDVTIQKLVYGGEGLAHNEGATVFVPLVLPGELVRANPIEQKKKFVRAELQQVLTPSPERIAPECKHFGDCGGCDYQHIPYEKQTAFKQEILRETLRRIGRVEWTGSITLHASKPYHYRNRAQWKVRTMDANDNGADASATGASEKTVDGKAALRIGYFRARSTTLCAVTECPIVSPLLEKTLKSLREALSAAKLPRGLREIEAVVDDTDTKLLITASFAGFPQRAADFAATFREILPEMVSLLFHNPGTERMELFGPGYLEYTANGTAYRLGHFSFFQVNKELVDEMAREVVDKDARGRLAFDLFSGVGLFSVPLSQQFEKVLAVESNPAATRDLESGFRGAKSIEVRTNDVSRFIQKNKQRPDFVVLDPPRAGLEPGDADRIARLQPQQINYVSCDPPTLARDLAAFQQSGYEITDVHLFDLFPQTYHIETLVRLRRKK
jgi:23S rRNA (uracil1939-C5)-methyltransferase